MLGLEHGDFRLVPEFSLLSPGTVPMIPHQKRTLSPITQRMAGEMLVRNLAPRTIDTYTYHVERFAKHFGKPLDELGPEEVHLYQLHLVEVKKAAAKVGAVLERPAREARYLGRNHEARRRQERSI